VIGIRFNPPPIDLPPEVDWLLARAFGPLIEDVSTGNLDPERILDLGERLALLARIRSRFAEETLRRALGEQSVEPLRRDFYSNVATMMMHETALCDIAEVSSQAGFSIILLKGMALQFLGKLIAGSRRLADIDILVPETECQPLYHALLESGFSRSGAAEPGHHLSVLFHPLGSALEIHHTIDGVRLSRQGNATADLCLQGRHALKLTGFPDHCYLPSEPLLLAQLLVHDLAQHGKAPDSYPAFQLVADLQDLGPPQFENARLIQEVKGWTSRALSAAEIEAAIELTRRLSGGEAGSSIAHEDSDCSVLLRHFAAGALDPTYVDSLKLSYRLEAKPGRGRLESLARTAWGALWLTDLQVELLYGQPKSSAGYLAHRLWRPFDLLIRLIRYSKSWFTTRFKGRSGGV